MPIRVPTADPYAWWRIAVEDPSTPRFEDEPQAGFYRRRYVARGPWVPVEIRLVSVVDPETGELTEPERFEAVELGEARDPYRIWLRLRPISEAAWRDLVERHETEAAFAATHAPLDLSRLPTRP